MNEKYKLTNDKFSPDSWIATKKEIIDFIISCNDEWETDYEESDFDESNDSLYCRGEHIADLVIVK